MFSWSFVFDISGTSSYRFFVHEEREGMVERAASGVVGYTCIKSKGEMEVRASQPVKDSLVIGQFIEAQCYCGLYLQGYCLGV